MTPEKQINRGLLGIDIDRLHIAGQGFHALNNITSQFEAFAESFSAEHGLSPKQVTLKDYFQFMQAQTQGDNSNE